MVDCDEASGPIRHQHRDQEGTHPPRALGVVGDHRFLQGVQPTNGRRDHHADAVRVFTVDIQARLSQGFTNRCCRKELEAIPPAQLASLEEIFRSKAFYLAGDLHL